MLKCFPFFKRIFLKIRSSMKLNLSCVSLKFMMILLLFVWWMIAGVTALRRDPLDRPNFVLFLVDDVGYGDCGFTGHPTASTPNIDQLAWNGKILTSWYSACSVCSCSRAALMTGRQYTRTGIKEVFGPVESGGLPLYERTIAEQLKLQNYTTGIVGKWHLGQRPVYLPGNRGFDFYLGIPYSDDMGNVRYSQCIDQQQKSSTRTGDYYSVPWNGQFDYAQQTWTMIDNTTHAHIKKRTPIDGDYASLYLPLIYQESNRTLIVEQPLDLTTLSDKYNQFATEFIARYEADPFFLYVPFTQVHVTSNWDSDWNQRSDRQYSGCKFDSSNLKRGAFGAALAELDWMVGNVYKALQKQGLEENTLILFTSDNGPWSQLRFDGGSFGIFSGLHAKYRFTGKASTWEGGIRVPAFAYWKGQIDRFTRSSEIVSSMDVFPTFSRLAGVPMPDDRIFDGRDMTDILLGNGTSRHDFLFIFGFCNGTWPRAGITAVRHGPFKAHWCTSAWFGSNNITYNKYPLMFNVDQDPSEAYPVCDGTNPPVREEARLALDRISRAYALELATFEYGNMVPAPDSPDEGNGQYGLCCDRSTNCSCNRSFWNEIEYGLFTVGSRLNNYKYQDILREPKPKLSSSGNANLTAFSLFLVAVLVSWL